MKRELQEYWDGKRTSRVRQEWFHEIVLSVDGNTPEDRRSLALSESLILRADGAVLINNAAFRRRDPIDVEFQPGWHAFRRLSQITRANRFWANDETLVIKGPLDQVLYYRFEVSGLGASCTWVRCIPRDRPPAEAAPAPHLFHDLANIGEPILFAVIRIPLVWACLCFLPAACLLALIRLLSKGFQFVVRECRE